MKIETYYGVLLENSKRLALSGSGSPDLSFYRSAAVDFKRRLLAYGMKGKVVRVSVQYETPTN